MTKNFLNSQRYSKGMIMDSMETLINLGKQYGLLSLERTQIEDVVFKFVENYNKLKT